ncbi:MAG: S26 family signal peptidase [Ferruginibacter sp.]|nr:S26 family signal peptidase [Ferruginibacter sp.]
MGWIIFIVVMLGSLIGLYGMFKKAGIAPWKALIPLYNTWCMVQKMELKKVWFFLQLIPIAGQFITIWICIKFVEHFGRFGFLHHAATVFIPFIYFPYLGFSKNERYAGIAVVKNYKKSGAREWIDAAVFAIVAATLIRTFVFEAYTIPTPSEEKTLLVNDFLFVSKMAYGPRIPNTPLAMPFVHHTIPGLNVKSYVEWIHIPYTRWFASPVKRNDAVVFNFPVNDTLINTPEYGSQITYYEAIRQAANQGGRDKIWELYGDNITTRPVDKRENFIKRCVAVAGDTLQIMNGVVHINGKAQESFPKAERFYKVINPKATSVEPEDLKQLGITIHEGENIGDVRIYPNGETLVNITNDEWYKMTPANKALFSYYTYGPTPDLFPYYDDSTGKNWSSDNYGPIWVPKKGASIQLTPDNLIRYRRCIEVYEGNKFENRGGKYFINGAEAASYTFKMDYFWLMGDNRHNSLDSRYWGFVPEDHVVGRASLIWFSYENGPRWNRLFRWIK